MICIIFCFFKLLKCEIRLNNQFIINFYNDNRVVEFEKEQPEEGYLLVGEKDYPHIAGKYSDKYKFTDILKSPRKGNDVKDIIHIYQFEKIK